jgi:predicted ferric reductase
MSALELSSDVGLIAVFVLTFNILLGVLLGVRYNPWRHWPHRRINYFKIHNWTGYVALALCVLHPLLLLASSDAHFRVLDVLYPLHAPKQPVINTLGALSLYVILLVVATSYFRVAIGRDRWKVIHYGAYGAAALFYVHGIWSDPTLTDRAIDFVDAEKVSVELCMVLVIAASLYRGARYTRRAGRGARAQIGGRRSLVSSGRSSGEETT